MSVSRAILIISASGHIGQQLVPLLLSSDPAVRLVLPTSNDLNADILKGQYDSGRVTVEKGSIKDPEWVEKILEAHQVEYVFLCLSGEDELFTTLNFLDCVAHSRTVKHLVYLSACADFTSEKGTQHVLRHCTSAHVLVKILLEKKLEYGHFPFTWTVLRPSIFFENDLRSRTAMLERGVYDEPLGGESGASRVSTSDIALAVKNVIYNDTQRWHGKHISIGSKKAYKASEVARLWSSSLERPISIYGTDEDSMRCFEREFGARIGGVAGKAWGRDTKLMYDMFSNIGFGMSEGDYQTQVELLGKEAEDYDDWVHEVAKSWKI